MGDRIRRYRETIRELGTPADLVAYLAEHSGLPGPRGNLELAQAVAEEADPATLGRLAGSDDEFEVFCGVVGLGRLVADGQRELLPELRRHAGDERWRVREATAMALQRWGDADLPAMLEEARRWASGSRYEQRAAAAGCCEPRLLRDRAVVRRVLDILDDVTTTIPGAEDRGTEAFLTLRQALGYCWSVVVAADPVAGLARFSRWRNLPDPDVQWLIRENLRKKRLAGIVPG